ncbi:hypothetical protein Tco_0885645 [Tanacetum coccineum]
MNMAPAQDDMHNQDMVQKKEFGFAAAVNSVTKSSSSTTTSVVYVCDIKCANMEPDKRGSDSAMAANTNPNCIAPPTYGPQIKVPGV